MANHTSSSGIVTIGGNTVAEVSSYTIDESVATIDDTEMTDSAETHKPDITSWSGSIECFWDDADTTGQGAMTIGASVSVVFLPEGNASGNVSRSGTATIESKSMALSKGSMITQSFTLKGNGALTDSTVA